MVCWLLRPRLVVLEEEEDGPLEGGAVVTVVSGVAAGGFTMDMVMRVMSMLVLWLALGR